MKTLSTMAAITAATFASTCNPGEPTEPTPTEPQVELCDASGSDAYTVNDAWIDGDTLHALVSYSGGCQDHTFDACWDGSMVKTLPVKVYVDLDHEANDDMCEAWLTEEVTFDLTDLTDQIGDDEVVILIDGYSLLWTAP